MMPATLALLILLGAVGAWDVGWYHLIALRLYSRCEHKLEQLAHLLRGMLFVSMLAGAACVKLGGAAATGFLCLFALDFANTLADTLLERKSRARFGGLSHGEYIVHICGSVISGCAAMAAFFESAPLRARANAFQWRALGELDRLERAALGLGLLTVGVWTCEFLLTFRAALLNQLASGARHPQVSDASGEVSGASVSDVLEVSQTL